MKTKTRKAVDLSFMAVAWGRPTVPRNEAYWFGVSPQTVANADASGTGPSNRFYIGKKVHYPTPSFIAYLEARARLA
jgi:hypothetical protein